MGAWGAGSFENDDALDLVDRLQREGEAAIRAALEDVTGLGERDYLEAPEASAAIAAAEVVAAVHDAGVSRLPETAQEWVDTHRDGIVAPPLLPLARRALERVLKGSELKDLWEEGGVSAEALAWTNGVRHLMQRLEEKPAPARDEKGRRKVSRTAKAAFEPGAILRVDLDDQWHTYARILARSPMIAFYDCRVDASVEDLKAIVQRPVLFVLAVGGRAHTGQWPKIGHVPLDAAPIPIPNQFMQDIGTGQCEIVDEDFNTRPAAPEECIGLERVAVWAPEHVTERLRDHYAGRPNAHLAHMKVTLAGSRWHRP
jgi:hypothetical protein